MPYIITTTADDPHVGTPAMERVTVTRTAVATLDEARDVVTGIVEEREPFSHKVQETAGSNLSAMRESGGTIGPLPDGTVIEVRPASWHELIAANGGLCGHPITACDDESLAEVIAAFNAR